MRVIWGERSFGIVANNSGKENGRGCGYVGLSGD